MIDAARGVRAGIHSAAMRRYLDIATTAALALAGCSLPFGDDIDDLPPLDTAADTDTSAETGETGNASDTVIVGLVVGADGLPLAGVSVTGGAVAVDSGADGSFSVEGAAPVRLRFERVGLHAAERRYDHSVSNARVGLQPRRAPAGFDSGAGVTLLLDKLTVAPEDDATAIVPAGALGEGMVAVTFDALDLTAGMHTLPLGPLGADGQIATILATAVIDLAGGDGARTASVPITVTLPLVADSTAGAASILRAEGGAWVNLGDATIIAVGDEYAATFTVTDGGTYAIGRLDAAGCVSGKAVDGNGDDAAGALVRSYLRPVAAGIAGYVDETVAAADGSFCVTGSAAGTAILVDYVDGTGAAWSSATNAAAVGSLDTCEECNEIGNVALALAGCATGNLFAADGSDMLPSPFAYEEGDIASSDIDADGSSVTFYARAGTSFHLRGPGGLRKTFSVTGGTTPTTSDCTRLGNLQSTESCVLVDVTDSTGTLPGVTVTHGSGVWTTTADEGSACVSSEDGDTTYTASRTVGAQSVSTTSAAAVDAVGGSCLAGECFAGPLLSFADAGCVEGVLYGEGGVAEAGVTLWSSSWDSITTGADGAYSLATAGSGRGAIWGGTWPVTTFDDQPASGGCSSLDLYADAGAPPSLVVAMDIYAWRVDAGGTDTTLISSTVGQFTDIQADTTADLLLGLLNVYTFAGDAEGAGWANFGSSSAYWSAARLSPDGSMVALQGYGSLNPAVWLYDLDGDTIRPLSTNAGTDPDGLAFAADGLTLASTRVDGGIEAVPVNGARSPTTIAAAPCAHPVFWDTFTVALDCRGDVYLYETDGSGSVSFLLGADSERVWAMTSTNRVVYTSGDTLRIANIDLSDEHILYTGSPGTTFRRVRATADGLWVAAIVDDPVTGTDVVAVPDQAPYESVWLTETPSESETSIDWLD